MIHSESGVAERGCVFRTNLPNRGEGTWVMTRQDASLGEVEFVVHYAQRFIEVLTIRLTEPSVGATELHWQRAYTALGKDGERFLEHDLDKMIQSWASKTEAALKHFLHAGKKLIN